MTDEPFEIPEGETEWRAEADEETMLGILLGEGAEWYQGHIAGMRDARDLFEPDSLEYNQIDLLIQRTLLIHEKVGGL